MLIYNMYAKVMLFFGKDHKNNAKKRQSLCILQVYP